MNVENAENLERLERKLALRYNTGFFLFGAGDTQAGHGCASLTSKGESR